MCLNHMLNYLDKTRENYNKSLSFTFDKFTKYFLNESTIIQNIFEASSSFHVKYRTTGKG